MYPQFPAPGIVFPPPSLGFESAGYNAGFGLVGVDANFYADGPIDEAGVRAIVLHEMGHWHHANVNPKEFIRSVREADHFEFRKLIGMVEDSKREYRQLSGERYADQFAFRILGHTVDYNGMMARQHEAKDRREAA